MKITRPSRIVGAVLALVSMLFMQLVLAGYVCPKPAVDASLPTVAEMTMMVADMPGCDQMDVVQPSLCHASAHTLHQSLDKHEIPAVQPFVPGAMSLVLAHVALPNPVNPVDRNTVRQSGAPPPPLAIRNCCFRI